jgi:hypothetical protein
MNFKKINNGWAPEPNAPYPTVFKKNTNIDLMFFLNPFIYDNTNDDDIGILKFKNCLKFRLGSPNSDDFYYGNFRFKTDKIEFGEAYEIINSNWLSDFPNDEISISKKLDIVNIDLKHFIVFMRDDCFECIAEEFEFKNIGESKSFDDQIKLRSELSELIVTTY